MSACGSLPVRSESGLLPRRGRSGAVTIEATLTLMLFLTFWFSLFDFGFGLYFHHTLLHQARSAVRYGILNACDTTESQDQIKNLVLYDKLNAPDGATSGVLGLKPGNIVVNCQPKHLDVTITGYEFPLITLGFAGLHKGKDITVSLPMEYGL